MAHVVVVGASLAGLRAAEVLRERGFEGTITMVGDEPYMPYDRPPLSKNFLSGEWDADRVRLRQPEMFDALNATWITGVAATQLRTAENTVVLADGRTLTYDAVVLATGGVVRRLPHQPDVKGIHMLRSLDDATALRAEIVEGAHLVVIGAGFIGLEAAATATNRGAKVTVLEGLPAPLIRGLGETQGAMIGRVHERNGVTVRCNVRVESIEHADGHVTGVRLEGGDVVKADVVIVGIGVAPATQWLEDSGLTLRDGVVCNEFMNAGVPNVFAAGDMARWPNALFTDIEPDMRVEHWTSAVEEGAAAGGNAYAFLAGEEQQPYAAVPFFWSDQFDARIQFLGRATANAESVVVAGSEEDGKWCAAYFENGRLTGVLGVSQPKLVMPARRLLSQHTSREDALAHFARVTMPQ